MTEPLMTAKGDTSIRLSRVLPAAPERVFRAWTESEELKHWSCPEGASIEDARVDLRVGGRYRIRMRGSEGQIYTAVGVYRTIEPPHKLIYTWDWVEDENRIGETLVTVTFHDRDGSTEVVITQERFPNAEAADGHEQGWTSCLDRLVARLEQDPT